MLDKGRMHRSAQRTRDYSNNNLYDETRLEKQYEQAARIVVIDGDCLDVAICLKKIYPDCHPVVLNMASAHNPGGAWRNGKRMINCHLISFGKKLFKVLELRRKIYIVEQICFNV